MFGTDLLKTLWAHDVKMTSIRRHYVASTSLRRHVPAGNLPPPWPPNILNFDPPNIRNLPTPMKKNSLCNLRCSFSGEPGLVDRVLALHAGSRGFDSHRGHISERFFRSNRPGYPHPVRSELENSGIRVAVGVCSVTERWWWRPSYQTGKIVHVHSKHYKHKEDGPTAPGLCGNGSVPLSHSGNVVTRIGIHTQMFFL